VETRIKRLSVRLVLGATLLSGPIIVAACAPHYVRSSPLDLARLMAPGPALTRNVVLVSIDGLRPDAIERFGAETLQRLMREGSYSLGARTILPSKTLPSHASMLSGELPEDHGVLWNNVTSAETDVVEFPTIFSLARAHGYRTAAFFSKAKFQPLQRPGTLDYSQAPGGWFGRWSSRRTVDDIQAYLESSQPNVLFVHLTDPDNAGHSAGWMSEAYGRAVRETDGALHALMSATDEAYGKGNYALIVTADHGGHEYGHGSDDARDVTIPWIAWGQGVHAGSIAGPIDTTDTAATVLWLLGVETPTGWDGSPIVNAFAPLAAATGSETVPATR
jgi:predicted AlkP superfamily pyrophosphatase or phosphodiesterase